MARKLTDNDTPEQSKVRSVVEWYRTHHKSEYKLFCKQMTALRGLSASQYAELEGSPHRAIHEIPETMFTHLVQEMTPEEMVWFTTKKATHWFVRTFPEFAVPQVI